MTKHKVQNTKTPILRTPGVIAKELSVSLAQVQYVLRTRGHIKPKARAGVFRLYDLEALSAVREELARIAYRKQGSQEKTGCS